MVSALVPVIYNSDSLLISKYLFHSALIRGSAKWPVLYKRGSWKLTLSNTFMRPKCSTLNLFVVFAIYPEYYEPCLVSFFSLKFTRPHSVLPPRISNLVNKASQS